MLRIDCNSDIEAEGVGGSAGGDTGSLRPVSVETYALRADRSTGGLAYRRVSGPLEHGRTPDQIAVRLVGGAAHSDMLVHSTSWRCAPDGGIVLAYAVAPDPQPSAPARPLLTTSIARGDHPSRPTPPRVEETHVAAHAARHLAFLLETDATAAEGLRVDPALACLLRGLMPTLAGRVGAH